MAGEANLRSDGRPPCWRRRSGQPRRACRLSAAHFSRAFKQTTGLAPFKWLQQRRIARAKLLLADPDVALAEIALAVGFSAQPQFTTAFRRETGTTRALGGVPWIAAYFEEVDRMRPEGLLAWLLTTAPLGVMADRQSVLVVPERRAGRGSP